MNQFVKARLQLTLWYILLDFVVLLILSLGLYYRQTQDTRDVVLMQNFGGHIPRVLTEEQAEFVGEQMDALNYRFFVNLVMINSAILVAIGIFGYLLADRTLTPISNALKREKEFVSNVSHELRTPITAIQMASEVALRSANRSPDQYRAVLTQSLDESKRMRKMVDELLQITRSEAGGEIVSFNFLDLNEILVSVITELTPIAEQKNLLLVSDLSKDKVMVFGDRNKLKQLLIILVDNAIKYTQAGSIYIKTKSKPRSSVSVRDTGVGISKEDLPHIFEKFYRGDKARTDLEGSGLGLSIANLIAHAHKTHINVESVIGKGSEFSVTF